MIKYINLLPENYKQNLKQKNYIFKNIIFVFYFIIIYLTIVLNRNINKYEKYMLNLNRLILDNKFIESDKFFYELEKNKNEINELNKILQKNEYKKYNNVSFIIENIFSEGIDIIKLDNIEKENKIIITFKVNNRDKILKFIKNMNKNNLIEDIYIKEICNEQLYNKLIVDINYKNRINL